MTPEEIVGLIGNIANRPDLKEAQERQAFEIRFLVQEAKDDVIRKIRSYLLDEAQRLNFYRSSDSVASARELITIVQKLRTMDL